MTSTAVNLVIVIWVDQLIISVMLLPGSASAERTLVVDVVIPPKVPTIVLLLIIIHWKQKKQKLPM